MAKAVKLEDIAKCVGVSKVTVSKALADKSGVSEELRQRIKEIAKDLGYKSISVQKSKQKHGTGNIGVIIPCRFVDCNTSFYWAIYQNVVTKFQSKGYYTIIELLNEKDEKELVLPKMVQDKKVDGIVVIGQVCNAYSEYIWENAHIPTMFLDFYDTHMEYDTIITDGFYGMYMLTDYLVKMGHRKIYFVGTPLATSSITDRFFGYQKALLENNIAMEKHWIIKDRAIDSNQDLEVILPEELPTAFACNSDYTANFLVTKLMERGLSVPEDISVVGFDNYLYPNVSNIQLTTYEVEMDKMAELCVKTLLRKISGKEYVKGVQIITGHMVVKGSVNKIHN